MRDGHLMPTYLYECVSCRDRWDVIKPISQLDEPERCEKCDALGERKPVRVNFNGAADWNTQTWNPALGCYTKNTLHARKIAKDRGYEEIGNEKPDTIHNHFEKQREETREKRWEDAAREKVYGD